MAGMFLSELDEKRRYTDPDLETKEAKFGVSPGAAARTHALLNDVWQVSPELAARCLGSVATMPKLVFRQESAVLSERDITRRLASKRGLFRRKGSRWTWHTGSSSYLFVDGREYAAALGAKTKPLLEALCQERHFTATWLAEVRDADLPLLRQLVNDGHLLPQR
jgi:ribosomal protein L16 Arg81 hydroxylase